MHKISKIAILTIGRPKSLHLRSCLPPRKQKHNRCRLLYKYMFFFYVTTEMALVVRYTLSAAAKNKYETSVADKGHNKIRAL